MNTGLYSNSLKGVPIEDWIGAYLRTKDDVEIDLIVERPGQEKLLVEIKSKSRMEEADAKALETVGSVP